jgi:hypothetical protein
MRAKNEAATNSKWIFVSVSLPLKITHQCKSPMRATTIPPNTRISAAFTSGLSQLFCRFAIHRPNAISVFPEPPRKMAVRQE